MCSNCETGRKHRSRTFTDWFMNSLQIVYQLKHHLFPFAQYVRELFMKCHELFMKCREPFTNVLQSFLQSTVRTSLYNVFPCINRKQ